MTDKDKIRAEVYRRFIEAGKHIGVIAETREDELSSLLSFIDSMSEEPKFKVGDWVVNNEDGSVGQITKIIHEVDDDGLYAYEHTNGYFHNAFEKDYHLWTIKDTKRGDVLVAENGWTCIFKELEGENFSSFCFMDSGCYFYEGSECHTTDERICGKMYPATNEQRDLLFQKMKEAGYEWDSDKLELKKIEQKPDEWHREDEQNLNAVLSYIDDELLRRWLKNTIHVRYNKPAEWSEEDNSRIDSICYFIREYGDQYLGGWTVLDLISWLKSLRPQNHWKPSEEQMAALRIALGDEQSSDYYEGLNSLYYDIKKL